MDLNWMLEAPFGAVSHGDQAAPAFSLESEETLTYADLRDLRDRYAQGLLDLGVGRGDRVGILLVNGVEYVALLYAAARIGAIAVRLNFRLTAEEIAFALDDSGPRVVCFSEGFEERVAEIHNAVEVEEWVAFGAPPVWARGREVLETPDTDGLAAAERPSGADPLMLMYTSGTTGRPKAAVWSHANALGCATSQAMQWGYDASTVALTTGPLYHAGAFEALLLPALLRGGRAICTRFGGFDVARTVAVMEAEGVTDAMLYPFMIYDLLRLPECDAGRLSTLRRIVTGGDPIVGWALDAARERLPDVDLVQSYGLTEGTAFTCLGGPELERNPDAAGRPLPLNEVIVVDDSGAEVGAGEVGEVLLRGPGATRAYWKREEETAATFIAGGWLRTGDLGRASTDGILFLEGRKKDIIRSGGENISPAEVESILTDHAAIVDAAVIAVPDEQFLEVGCAVLEIAAGAEVSDEEVFAYCRSRLAGYKCPRYVVRVEEVPRNASGKVVKETLRRRYRHLGSPIPS